MQTIYLDISSKIPVPRIHAKQGEVGRKFMAVISDNGMPFNITDDILLSVWYEGDTDAGNYSSIEERSAFSVDGHRVVVELVAQMLLSPGDGMLCLTMTQSDGGEISTWNIPYSVEEKPGSGSAVPTEYYTALTEAGATAATQVELARAEKNGAEKYRNEAKEASEAALAASDEAKAIVGESVYALANILTPVGYIFTWESVDGNGIDLSTASKVQDHFGFGTWEQIKDVFLLSCGDTHAIGTSGGSENHTLTVQELPEHNHFVPNFRITNTTDLGSVYTESFVGGSDSRDLFTAKEGGNQPFSIMPPYRAVYTWKRIA